MRQRDVFEDLREELDLLDEVLEDLDDADWDRASLCEGWTVADVVLHLAQTEEAVPLVFEEGAASPLSVEEATDPLVAGWVEGQRGASPAELLERWRRARQAAYEALVGADPSIAVPWAVVELKPRTLATTRLAEHWAHGLDITVPLGRELADTDRLWHVARLAHRTLPFAFARAGRPAPPDVHFALTSPKGEPWTFGDPSAGTVVRGPAGELCRVAARRLPAEDAPDLEATGPRADEVLDLVRTYA